MSGGGQEPPLLPSTLANSSTRGLKGTEECRCGSGPWAPSPGEGGDDHQGLALPSDRHTGALLGPDQDAGLGSLGPLRHLLCPQPLDGEAVRLSGFLGQVRTPSVQRANFLPLGRLLPFAFPIRPVSVSPQEFSYSDVLRSSSLVSRAFNCVCSHGSPAQGVGPAGGERGTDVRALGPGPG